MGFASSGREGPPIRASWVLGEKHFGFEGGSPCWLGRALPPDALLSPGSFWQVLHPGLLSQVHMDLLLMKIGSKALGLVPGVKWLSLPGIVEEFEKLMVQQVNPPLSCK